MSAVEIYIIGGLAMFSNPSSLKRNEPIAVFYLGSEDVVLTVGGVKYMVSDEATEIRVNDLREGYIECRVTVNGNEIPCEGLKHIGGFIYPAGITNKAFVKNLFDENVELRKNCEFLQGQLDERAVKESEEDLLNI